MKIVMIQPSLPQRVKRDVFKGLTLASMILKNDSSRKEYLDQVLKPLHDRFLSLVKHPDFARLSHEENTKLEILNILDCIIG